MKRLDQDQSLSSEIFTRELGRTLAEEYDGTGILKSAYLKKRSRLHPCVYRFRDGAGYWNLGHE